MAMLPYSNLRVIHQNPGAEMPLILPIHVICNTPDDLLYENIKINSKKHGDWLRLEEEHDGVAILCGSGPSLADTLDEIRSLVKAGGKVFAMNGAARFLAEEGIYPDYQVILDARPETAQLVGPAKEHLFASQVHPDTFDKMPTARLWHLQIGGIEDLFPEYERSYCLIGGAASVGNTATCLAYAMGYRKLELFGYDSCHKDTAGHAFEQKMNEGDPVAHVTFNGKHYVSSLTMKLQAERFLDTSKALIDMGVKISVHGYGLLPDMFNDPKLPLTELEKYQRVWSLPAYGNYSAGELNVEQIIEVLKPTMMETVLDFGCGTGRCGRQIYERTRAKVIQIDFVEYCRDKDIHLPFVKHDLTQPIKLQAACGVCSDVMEHFPTEDVEKVIRNIMSAADRVFFQISTIDDDMGLLINQVLHLTVRPYQWWLDTFNRLGYAVKWSEEKDTQACFLISNTRGT